MIRSRKGSMRREDERDCEQRCGKEDGDRKNPDARVFIEPTPLGLAKRPSAWLSLAVVHDLHMHGSPHPALGWGEPRGSLLLQRDRVLLAGCGDLRDHAPAIHVVCRPIRTERSGVEL